MKHYLKNLLLVASIIAASAGCYAQNFKSLELKTIKVSNSCEFLEALGSNRIIEMASGKYNLLEWDPFLQNLKQDKLVKLSEDISWEEEYDIMTVSGGENIASENCVFSDNKVH